MDNQLCFVIATLPFQNTSLIINLFSSDWGHFKAIAKGAKTNRRVIIDCFREYQVSFYGKAPLYNIKTIELNQSYLLLKMANLSGHYVNELMYHLVGNDSCEQLYQSYQLCLQRLVEQNIKLGLRLFEMELLRFLGQDVNLLITRDGNKIEPNLYYSFDMFDGGIFQSKSGFHGHTLIGMHNNHSKILESKECQQLMKQRLQYALNGKVLRSWELFNTI